jgi:hypothetical protein
MSAVSAQFFLDSLQQMSRRETPSAVRASLLELLTTYTADATTLSILRTVLVPTSLGVRPIADTFLAHVRRDAPTQACMRTATDVPYPYGAMPSNSPSAIR